MKWQSNNNLRRFGGVSEAGAASRNPDPAKREKDLLRKWQSNNNLRRFGGVSESM